jgi:hypothetical protein
MNLVRDFIYYNVFHDTVPAMTLQNSKIEITKPYILQTKMY